MSSGREQRGGGASLVAAGILLSRVFGLIRTRLLAHFLGAGDAADALNAAIRIPNVLQNMFGEGVLSASFIPAYARALGDGADEDAGQLAGAIGALLVLVSTVLVLLGVLLTPIAIPLIAPGFVGEKRELTVLLVRIMFPGVGLLVVSAWSLGILNAHRRFFLAYASPVAFNLVVIGTLVVAGTRARADEVGGFELAEIVAWASVAGSALQCLIQLPTVWRIEKRLRLGRPLVTPRVRGVFVSFVPVFLGRGVIQLSAYADAWLASFLPMGALTILSNAQTLSVLPVSLFGMAVSAAALPEMSRTGADSDEGLATLRDLLGAGLHRVAFYVVPSAAALAGLGDVLGSTLFQTGLFGETEVRWLWGVLAGSALGLLASTLSRLYASVWYAVRDTRTPLRYAIVRVVLTLVLGAASALWLPAALGISARWGVAGLTASAGVAAWVEFVLLRRSVARRLGGRVVADGAYLAKLWLCAGLALLPTLALRGSEVGSSYLLRGLAVLTVYGAGYLVLAMAMRIPEVVALRARVARLWARR